MVASGDHDGGEVASKSRLVVTCTAGAVVVAASAPLIHHTSKCPLESAGLKETSPLPSGAHAGAAQRQLFTRTRGAPSVFPASGATSSRVLCKPGPAMHPI